MEWNGRRLFWWYIGTENKEDQYSGCLCPCSGIAQLVQWRWWWCTGQKEVGGQGVEKQCRRNGTLLCSDEMQVKC